MDLRIPSEAALRITTKRLLLEPLREGHAAEMTPLLADPALYRFLRQEPPSLEMLTNTYRGWEKRHSPDGKELWLNWIVRELGSGEAIGHLQAGNPADGAGTIAYTIGTAFQRRGYAAEGVRAVLNFFRTELSNREVKAWVDTRNLASIGLLERLGFAREAFLPKADHFKGADSDEYVYAIKLSPPQSPPR